MEISVRSYLTAGMAAVVGATAISLAPVQPAAALKAVELPASTVAQIALTGTSIPWETIATVVQALSSGGSLQAGVTALISAIGSEFAKEALPVVTAALGDVVKYGVTVLAELMSGPGAPEIDFAAIIQAATAAIAAGNLSGAVQALTSGLSAPLTQITQVLFTPEFQAFVTGKVGSVLGALPEILRAAVQTVVGIDIKPLIDAISGVLGGLLPAASLVAAPRILAAATAPAEAPGPVVADDVPAEDSAAKAPAADVAPAAPESSPAAEATPATEATTEATKAPEAPATEATSTAPEVVEVPTPALEVAAPDVTAPEVTAPEVVAPEVVVPVEAPRTVAAPEAADSEDAAPAVTPRAAKPGPRHSSAAKATAGRG